jgi:hypothetical protein
MEEASDYFFYQRLEIVVWYEITFIVINFLFMKKKNNEGRIVAIISGVQMKSWAE